MQMSPLSFKTGTAINDLADLDTGATYVLTVLITNYKRKHIKSGELHDFRKSLVESPTKADIDDSRRDTGIDRQ